ncbi:MAG: topoisomerase DNA-binding C4 zinc finger domain-containing protein, partial [Selenomonadaceae bacterium]|nr:topoisomerase DNA-binding C4 zinc finger domain-containing protein [Selenomonadaceae bacterium]
GEGTLDDFLNGQIKFTSELCSKAQYCKIKAAEPTEVEELPKVEKTYNNKPANKTNDATDEGIACPLCKKGHLVRRNGRNGIFWGCSNFPKCRMTCNDVEGKPQFKNQC